MIQSVPISATPSSAAHGSKMNTTTAVSPVTANPNGPQIAKCHNNARAEVEKWTRRALDKGVMGYVLR